MLVREGHPSEHLYHLNHRVPVSGWASYLVVYVVRKNAGPISPHAFCAALVTILVALALVWLTLG